MGGLSQRQARLDAGVPEPVLRYEPNDMWLEFAFDAAYLKVLRAGQKQTEPVEAQVTPPKSPPKWGACCIR
jgi:hypothetical protein